jgi:hypothetical protein
MRHCRFFICLILLFTFPSFTLCSYVDPISIEKTFSQYKNSVLSYDDFLNLIDELEQGELEKKCSSEELVRLSHFFAILAKEGVLSHNKVENFILEEDIRELLAESCEYSFFPHPGDDYFVASAVNDQEEILLCKSWLHKKWKKVAKFVAKHKKAIIIGAVIVTATVIAVCVVAAASTAAVAATAAAATEDSPDTNESASSTPETIPIFNAVQEAPVLKAALDEQNASFKEHMSVDNFSSDDQSLKEKVRNFGALLAHQALDGISELISFVPKLNQEINEIAVYSSINHDNPTSVTSSIDPVDTYNVVIGVGHQKIDQVFSTNQSVLYTPEIKASRCTNNFEVGIIPPPGEGFTGKKGWELKNPEYQTTRNVVTSINGRIYRGHALDQMQNRGIPPSVVEQTIEKGKMVKTNKDFGTVEYFDEVNGVKVVLNDREEVVTAIIMGKAK